MIVENEKVKVWINIPSSYHFALLKVSSLSIQDILEKFRMDGTPARSDLVPIQPKVTDNRPFA